MRLCFASGEEVLAGNRFGVVACDRSGPSALMICGRAQRDLLSSLPRRMEAYQRRDREMMNRGYGYVPFVSSAMWT